MSAKYDNTDGRLRGRGLQARRLRKWTEATGCCALCGDLTDYPNGFQLDHIKALVNGGEDKEEQTQVLCLPCHDKKTAIDLGHRERVAIGADGWPEGTGGKSGSLQALPLETAPNPSFSHPQFERRPNAKG